MPPNRMLLALAWLALLATTSLGEKKKEEEMCSQCNCEAVTSSLSCLSDAWQSLTCNLSHTNTCPGTFNLTRGYMFAERMEDISEAGADERQFLSRSRLGCHDNVYLEVKSSCCNFYQRFEAEKIVSPGELDFNCKGCGVQPQKGGQAISFNFTRHDDLHCYSTNFTFRYSLRWQEEGVATTQSIKPEEKTLENVTCFNFNNLGIHVTSLSFEDLQPYRNYSLEVRGQPMFTAHPNVWSSWLKTTATTEPSFPLPPSSSPLAFMVSDSGGGNTELITFHWRKQPLEKQHGPEFQYLVNDEEEVSVPYWRTRAPSGKKVILEVAGLNSVGKSREVLRMLSQTRNKRGHDSGVGPSVVLTTVIGDTVVLYGQPGKEVVERHLIWGEGPTHDLLEEGIDWADASNTAGSLTLPKTNPRPQHVFLAGRNADGYSRGMERVDCRLTPRHAPNISLVLANASSNSIELEIGLGLCRGEEDDKLLFQKATVTICTSKDNCNSTDTCESPSHHYSTSVSLNNLATSTCFCIGLKVETVLGNATLAPSSSCSFHTAPVRPPTILAAALLQGEADTSAVLLVNLKNSTFPTSETATCHIRVTSSATPIQMPCQEVLIVSLPSGSYLPHHPSNVSVKAVLGGSQGPWSEEKSVERRPLPPKLVGARMENDTVGVTFNRASASSSLSSCEVNISKSSSEADWHLLSIVNPHCEGTDCTAASSMPLSSCSTYQLYMRCSTVVHLAPSTTQSLRPLLNSDHFNTADQVDSFDLLLTSDWSPIYSRDSQCLPSGTSPLYILLVVVIVLVIVAAILLYLWRFSERVQRLIKRFNFKLPNHVPPLEVPSLREPFMSETPRPRPIPPSPRTPSSPSPPSEFPSSPTFVGPSVERRTVYTPTRNYSQGSTGSGYQAHPPPYVQLQSIRSRTTTTTSLASSEYVPLPDVLLLGQELEDCWEEPEDNNGEES